MAKDLHITGWQLLPWEHGPGPAKKARDAFARTMSNLEAELAAIDSDPRLRDDAKPAARREAAMKARRELRRIDKTMDRVRGEAAELGEKHLRSAEDSARVREVRAFLMSLDIGQRHVVVAQAVADGDREVMQAVHSAPKILSIVQPDTLQLVADTLSPEGAQKVREAWESIEAVHVAHDIVSGFVEAKTGLTPGEFTAAEQREQRHDPSAFAQREKAETAPAEHPRFPLGDTEARTKQQAAALAAEVAIRRELLGEDDGDAEGSA